MTERDHDVPEFRLKSTPEGVSVVITEVAGRQAELLEAFQGCQSGTCTCPTDEYGKVNGMEIGATDDEIALRLRAKPGAKLDAHEIATCLDHTIAQTEKP
jgi:hypothetical protein